MRNGRFIWLVGACAGALDAALVIALMIAIDALAGPAFGVIGDSLGLAFVDGPGWLASAIAAGSILAAGVIGGRAARRDGDSLFSAAMIGVLVLVGSYVVWVFVWTVWRLGVKGSLGGAPFLPFEAALLAFAGLILPAIALFLPSSLLWARVVGAVLYGGPAHGHASR